MMHPTNKTDEEKHAAVLEVFGDFANKMSETNAMIEMIRSEFNKIFEPYLVGKETQKLPPPRTPERAAAEAQERFFRGTGVTVPFGEIVLSPDPKDPQEWVASIPIHYIPHVDLPPVKL